MNKGPIDKPSENLAMDSQPFVLGFLSDLAGHASSDALVLERITKETFNSYFASVAPSLHLTCFPFIPDEHHRVEVQLDFKSMADFEVTGLRRQLLAKWETSLGFMDALIDSILHDLSFMQLEASWRNLSLLVENYSAEQNVEIMVGSCSKSSLATSIRCPIVGLNELNEFNNRVSQPFTAILFDFEFSHRPNDLKILERLGELGSKHQTLMLCSATPELFGMHNWTELPLPRSILTIFESNQYREWNKFRESEAAKWIFMTVSSVLSRFPNALEWVLQMTEPFSDGILFWTNSATCLATVLLEQHRNKNYFEKLGGPKNASIKSLPTFSQQMKSGETERVGPTLISLSKARIQELESLGLNVLVRNLDPGTAFFPHLVCLAATNESEKVLEQNQTASSKNWNSISLRMLSSRTEQQGLEPADIKTILDQWNGEDQETLPIRNTPFVIGFVSDLASSRPDEPFPYRNFIEVSSKTLDQFIDYMKPASNWDNLKSLIHNSSASDNVKIRILDCTASELFKDFESSVCLEESHFYKLVCKHLLYSFEGEPFAMLIVDLNLEHSNRNTKLMQSISKVGQDAGTTLVVNSNLETP
jgi:predicted component of type VI protein secretion system